MNCLPADVATLSDEDGVVQHDGDHGAVPASVDQLSDDEAAEAAVLKRQRKAKELDAKEISAQTRRLRALVKSNCKCANGQCRKPFQDDAGLFDQLLQKRMQIIELPKLESDREEPYQHYFYQ